MKTKSIFERKVKFLDLYVISDGGVTLFAEQSNEMLPDFVSAMISAIRTIIFQAGEREKSTIEIVMLNSVLYITGGLNFFVAGRAIAESGRKKMSLALDEIKESFARKYGLLIGDWHGNVALFSGFKEVVKEYLR